MKGGNISRLFLKIHSIALGYGSIAHIKKIFILLKYQADL
jgi:hypothetical protein